MEFSSPSSGSGNDYRNFKPMYTLQPVRSTRDKQLKQWSDIVMQHCKENNISNINPNACPLFSNDTINRKLSPDGINAVVQNMINAGTHLMSFFNQGLLVFHYFVIFWMQLISLSRSTSCRKCWMGEWAIRQIPESFFESARDLS